MGKSLVIVESPTKAKTISRFLGKDFIVESSYGHVRDLPRSKLGVDVENNFQPQYVIPTKSRKQVNLLKKAAEKAERIILATDEDREGEAIAWHLTEALGLGNQKSKIKDQKVERIVFHEITKSAIEEALKNPRAIDAKRVDAQQARRVLDRLVGYSLSPFLWKKVIRGLSAGRVQSVAVRLIAEREREIQKFKPQEYWSIEAELFPVNRKKEVFVARLAKRDGQTLDKFAIASEVDAQAITKSLEGAQWQISSIEKRALTKRPSPPFTTSTLQQEAFRRIGFSARQTMRVAQQLYEGVELGEEGPVGLCVDESTLVITEDGSIHPIHNLDRVGKISLMGVDQETLQIRPTAVSKCWKIKAPKHIFHIETDDHEQIIITADHPLLVLRNGTPAWIRGEHLKRDDYLATCSTIPVARTSHPSSLIKLLQLLPKEAQRKTRFLVKKSLFAQVHRQTIDDQSQIATLDKILALLQRSAITEQELEQAYEGVVVSVNPNARFQKIPFRFSPELGYFIGLIVGDGYLGDRLNFSVTSTDRGMLETLNERVSAVLGHTFQKFSPARTNYHVDSTTLYHLLPLLGAPHGKKSHRIDIPNILLTQPDSILQTYLAGLWDTDGSIVQNYKMGSIRLSYSSRSEIFIDKLRLLLKTFGMNSSKHFDRRTKVWWLLLTSSAVPNFAKFVAPFLTIKKKTWDTLYHRYGYRYDDTVISYDQRVPEIATLLRQTLRTHGTSLLEVSKVTGVDFYNYYGAVSSGRTRNPFIQKATLARVAELADTPSKLFRNLSQSEIAWKPITRVVRKRYRKPYVYDVTTSTATFIANGIISHNCTYMRTDSVNLSEESLKGAASYIKGAFGQNYALPSPRRFKTKSKGAQEAHEAIRPTDPARTPDEVKQYLDRGQYRLYELIWRRFTATQMADALFDATAVDIEAKSPASAEAAAGGQKLKAKSYAFRATGQTMKFDGFLAVWPAKFAETLLPELSKNDELELQKLLPGQHFTEPLPRFSEASLIKELEANGIGRPSTYAPTIATIQDRGYVEKDEAKRLRPTEVGLVVNDLLVEHFPQIVDIQFTAKMEEELDEIAEGKREWQPVIKEFYEPFSKNLAEKYAAVEKQTPVEETDQVCEKCAKPMVIKYGRFGKFLACSGFPECKNAKPLPKEPPKSTGVPCAECKAGEIVERFTRKGRRFFSCSRYPECKHAMWTDPRTTQAKEKAAEEKE